MPNWCSNSVVIYGDKAELVLFYNKYVQACQQQKSNNEWGTYCLFSVHGYSKDFILSDKSDWIRGPIFEPEDQDYVIDSQDSHYFRFFFESAWSPMIDGLSRILRDHYPHLQFVLVAEECGEGIYINTDVEHKFFDEKYLIYHDDHGSAYFSTDEEVISYVKETFGYEIKDINALADDECIDYADDQFFNFYRFTTI